MPVTRRRRPRRPASAALTCVCATVMLIGGLSIGRARAEPYSLGEDAWDGLSALAMLADEMGVVLSAPRELDLGETPTDEAILVVYPTRSLPRGLSGFMAEGGRVAIADDFGESASFLEALEIRREPATQTGLRGNPQLPVATPGLAHPLTEGVNAVVTNHPASIRHPSLEAVLRLRGVAPDGSDDRAVVVAGGVGEGSGRLIAIGDPSVLINNMMQFRGNRRFAQNLLEFLVAQSASRRVHVITRDAVLHGRVGAPNAERPLERLRLALDDAARAQVPAMVLRIATACFVLIGLIFLASALPRRSPYLAELISETRRHARGGLVGRIAHFANARDMLHPLLVYRHELFTTLRNRLGLHPGSDHRDVLRALESHPSIDGALRREAATLLQNLDQIWHQVDRPPGPGRISAKALERMVQTGERLVASLPLPE